MRILSHDSICVYDTHAKKTYILGIELDNIESFNTYLQQHGIQQNPGWGVYVWDPTYMDLL